MSQQPSPEMRSAPSQQERPSGIDWSFIVLILLGLTFVLQSMRGPNPFVNWWSTFILLPALALVAAAWVAYEQSGSRFTLLARVLLSVGVIVMTVALMFLFDVSWALGWPFMLIVPSLAVVVNGVLQRWDSGDVTRAGIINTIVWTGASAALLGGGFLFNNLGFIDVRASFGAFQWWGVFILLPGVGALRNALRIFRVNSLSIAAQLLFALGLAACVQGTLILLGALWNDWLWWSIVVASVGVTMLSSIVRRQSIS
jgi:hypothetical protein